MNNITEYSVLLQYQRISYLFTKYAGVCLYMLCSIGTLLNILTFFQQTYQKRACSLYLLVASLCDLIHLNLGPLSNILQFGFHYDWTISSTLFCKMKSYLVFVFTIISATFTCLASIDRFLLSSKKTSRWRFTSRSIALRLTLLIILFCFLFSLPIIFCYTRHPHLSHNEEMICSNPSQSAICFWIQLWYTCIFNGFLPPLAMIYFGFLTCINARHLRRRCSIRSARIQQINYQLTMMLVLQSIKSSVASLPFSIFNSYLLITSGTPKSSLLQVKEALAHQLVYLLFWSNYTSFFVYIYSSDIFRRQCRRAIRRLFCCEFVRIPRCLLSRSQ